MRAWTVLNHMAWFTQVCLASLVSDIGANRVIFTVNVLHLKPLDIKSFVFPLFPAPPPQKKREAQNNLGEIGLANMMGGMCDGEVWILSNP